MVSRSSFVFWRTLWFFCFISAYLMTCLLTCFIIILLLWEFFIQVLAECLSLEFECEQVSSNLLVFFSILADLKNSVVCTVSTRPLISKPSSPVTNPYIPSAPITTRIIITFMFHSFQFSCKVLILITLFTFFKFFSVICWDGEVHYSVGSLFFFCWLSLDLVVWPSIIIIIIIIIIIN